MSLSQDSGTMENPRGNQVPPPVPVPPSSPPEPKPPAAKPAIPPTPVPPPSPSTQAKRKNPRSSSSQPLARKNLQQRTLEPRLQPVSQPVARPNTELPNRTRSQTLSRRFFSWRKVPQTASENAAKQEEEGRRAPSWLVSFVFHLALLLILALIPIRDLTEGSFSLMLGEAADDKYGDIQVKGDETADTSEMVEVEPVSVVEETADPIETLKLLEMPDFDVVAQEADLADTVKLETIPFGIRNGLTGRQGPLKDALLAKFGGSAETESAVELGLKWLAKQQKSDGSWSLIGPYSDGGAQENRTAATALALNAFLGAGYTHQEGKYASNVKLGLKYLTRRQDSEGFYSKREPSRQQMYAQAIASIAVTEAYGMTEDEELRQSAMRAIQFAEWSQSRKKGWRYEPREDADLSVTGWFLMALQTARMAGLPASKEKIGSVSEFLDSVSFEDQTRYAYSDFERDPSLSMTAEGVLCRIYLGWTRSDPSLLSAVVDDLLPNKPEMNAEQYSVYYWYYATQVLHHVGGKYWDEWNEAMKATLPKMQVKSSDEAGSWDPGQDMFGASGGRLYTTCLNIYCLEVYYRHLALYDMK